jgi:hypothetical protein
MKALCSLLITLAATLGAVAEVPKKSALTKYTGLWTNSPFTSKPIIENGPPPPNPLEDYALCGVSPVGQGYRVTLLNKKKPEERITVDSDRSNKDGFKIIQVTRKAGDPLATVVRMQSSAGEGSISFDEKLLTIAAPAPRPQNPQAQVQPGMPQPQLQPGQIPQRQPRPRVVPPPTPQAQPQPPQIQPQPQPQPQVQPVQPVQGLQRPERHGGR